ncbi:erv26 super protein [Podila epigama]|nr:erv26 super protein [Podila epigama]
MWFQYFSRRYYNFLTIASFFGICVWLLPFAYFISLSANDNALPSFDRSSQEQQKQKKNGIFKSIFGSILNKKETGGPVLVETPNYTGFGSSSLGGSPMVSSTTHNRPTTPIHNAHGSTTGYNSFNPEGTTVHQHHPISRPGSSNSNYSGRHGFNNNNSHNNSVNQSPAYAGNHGHQQYASSSAVYNPSSSTVGSRF